MFKRIKCVFEKYIFLILFMKSDHGMNVKVRKKERKGTHESSGLREPRKGA